MREEERLRLPEPCCIGKGFEEAADTLVAPDAAAADRTARAEIGASDGLGFNGGEQQCHLHKPFFWQCSQRLHVKGLPPLPSEHNTPLGPSHLQALEPLRGVILREEPEAEGKEERVQKKDLSQNCYQKIGLSCDVKNKLFVLP
jgi:hypothetical protein